MMAAAMPTSRAVRDLIDARLDTIDRMLLGRVDRQERLDIVREVESQIFDQLGEREGAEPTRDDVLALLARLDPPEAYLPEEAGAASDRPRSAPRPARIPQAPPAADRSSRKSMSLGILSVGAFPCWVICFFSAVRLVEVAETAANILIYTLYGLTIAGLITGVLAVILAAKARLRGGLSIAGLVTGVVGILLAMMQGGYLLYLFVDGS